MPRATAQKTAEDDLIAVVTVPRKEVRKGKGFVLSIKVNWTHVQGSYGCFGKKPPPKHNATMGLKIQIKKLNLHKAKLEIKISTH